MSKGIRCVQLALSFPREVYSGSEQGELKTYQGQVQPDAGFWILNSRAVVRGLIFSAVVG